jgi:hypothetical protein
MKVIVFYNQFELVGTGLLRLKKTEKWSFMVPVTVLHNIRILGPVTVTVLPKKGQKTGLDRTFKH